jgi:putative OPT family oligopeptide transporter
MLVMSFFFTAVATYIVGLVGSSNSPVSGMTICAVLATGGLLTLFGYTGTEGMVATLGVAGVVCCVACTAGDTSNDLKTGLLVGASPRSQQIMQILGVTVAAFVLAPVLVVLHEGTQGGIGGDNLSAPQAGLFMALAQGFFGAGKGLPWNMIAWGAGIGVAIVVADLFLERVKSSFRLHVMPVAVGVYLPPGLSVTILAGGLLHWVLTRRRAPAVAEGAGPTPEERAAESARGAREKRLILGASGIIAGESLMGVLVCTLAYFGVTSLDPKAVISTAALLVLIWWLARRAKG